MQKYNKRPGPYKAFNYSNNFYKPNHKKTFYKKVSFSNKNYEQKYDTYSPPYHVPKYSNHPIKTKNRFEGLNIDDEVVHQNDYHFDNKDITQIRNENKFKSKQSKNKDIIRNENQSKDMEELTKHMIEKGPLTIRSNKELDCFHVSDLLREYRKIPVGGKMVYIDGKITPQSHQLPVQLVLDSGSSVSLISGKIRNQLKRLGIYPKKTNKVLVTTNPKDTKINEMIELPIEISDGSQTLTIKSQFLVSDYLPFESLIGNNILERYLDKLNYRNRYAEFRVSNTNIMGIPFGNNLRRMNSSNQSNLLVLSSWH